MLARLLRLNLRFETLIIGWPVTNYDLLVIGSKHWPCPGLLNSILVGDCHVCPSKTARKIAVVFFIKLYR